jgi:hypothetical protein
MSSVVVVPVAAPLSPAVLATSVHPAVTVAVASAKATVATTFFVVP